MSGGLPATPGGNGVEQRRTRQEICLLGTGEHRMECGHADARIRDKCSQYRAQPGSLAAARLANLINGTLMSPVRSIIGRRRRYSNFGTTPSASDALQNRS